MLEDFDIDLCIGCGTCSYVCPAKLKIASEITRGKMELVQYMNAKKEKEQNEEVSA